jgi:predicted dehydrogenase
MNYQQVSACIAEAKKQNTFLLEAVWMYFFPALAQTRHWIEAGKIGKPIMLDAGFHFATSQDPDSRLLNLNLGGGLC